MNNSDQIEILKGWAFFGRSEAIPLSAITAVYITYDDDSGWTEVPSGENGSPRTGFDGLSGHGA